MYLSLILFNVNLVAQNDKWEALRIMRTGLDEKFISPAVKSLKRLCIVDIVNEDTTVGASIECNSERLKSLLPSGIP